MENLNKFLNLRMKVKVKNGNKYKNRLVLELVKERWDLIFKILVFCYW